MPPSGESAISGFGTLCLFLFSLIVQHIASLSVEPLLVVPLKVGGGSLKVPESGPSGMKVKLKLGKLPAPAQGTCKNQW